jgi:hypothetical protein
MGQFDYLRDQISNNTWIDKEALQISDAVTTALNNDQEWYFNLPHIQFIMENSSLRGIKDLLTASQDLGATVLDCNLGFWKQSMASTKLLIANFTRPSRESSNRARKTCQ